MAASKSSTAVMRMTAESGETRCAWRSTSMPSMFGILMSVTIMSYSAPSILLRAASPELTVSTRWPSRRRAISSTSQMERSSSHTRMLPMARPSSRACRHGAHRRQFRLRGTAALLRARAFGLHVRAAQLQRKHGSLAGHRTHHDFSFVRLHNLINDGQPQPGAALEVPLEGLEDFFHLLLTQSVAVIGETDYPVHSDCPQRDMERTTLGHGAQRVAAQVPEHLLDLVAVHQGWRTLDFEAANDL